MRALIRIAILDDHQSIIDGYLHRLSHLAGVTVVATASFGEELEPMLAQHPVDVLLLDISVPMSASDLNPYPVLHMIPKLLQLYSTLHVLVISMHNSATLIRAIMEAGASGYILKDDRETIRNLDAVIRTVADGGIHFSQQAHRQLLKSQPEGNTLTPRQVEVLSLCAAYPDESTAELAKRLLVANSTVRNLLSTAYLKLDVRSRTAAVDKAKQLGLIPPLDQAVID